MNSFLTNIGLDNFILFLWIYCNDKKKNNGTDRVGGDTGKKSQRKYTDLKKKKKLFAIGLGIDFLSVNNFN
jgi:hypothetical protein